MRMLTQVVMQTAARSKSSVGENFIRVLWSILSLEGGQGPYCGGYLPAYLRNSFLILFLPTFLPSFLPPSRVKTVARSILGGPPISSKVIGSGLPFYCERNAL